MATDTGRPGTYARVGVPFEITRCTFVFPKRFNLHVSRHVEFRTPPPRHFGHVLSAPFARAAEQNPPGTDRGERTPSSPTSPPHPDVHRTSGSSTDSHGDRSQAIQPNNNAGKEDFVDNDHLCVFKFRNFGIDVVRTKKKNNNGFNFNRLFYSWIDVRRYRGWQTITPAYDRSNCHGSSRVSTIRKRVGRPLRTHARLSKVLVTEKHLRISFYHHCIVSPFRCCRVRPR